MFVLIKDNLFKLQYNLGALERELCLVQIISYRFERHCLSVSGFYFSCTLHVFAEKYLTFYIFLFSKEEGVIRTMEAPKVSYPIFDKV